MPSRALPLFLVCSALAGAAHPALLPQPRKIVYGEGKLPLADLAIVSSDRFEADELARRLGVKPGGRGRRITLSRTGPDRPLPLSDMLEMGLEALLSQFRRR